MLNIIDQNAIRKIDAQGRIIIPKGIRDMMNWDVGEEINFYLVYENSVPTYVGLRQTVDESVDPKYEVALAVLEELGIAPPPQLLKKINGDK